MKRTTLHSQKITVIIIKKIASKKKFNFTNHTLSPTKKRKKKIFSKTFENICSIYMQCSISRYSRSYPVSLTIAGVLNIAGPPALAQVNKKQRRPMIKNTRFYFLFILYFGRYKMKL